MAPFHALGVPPVDVTFGHPLDDECARLGIDVDAYLGLYDATASQPFPGVTDLLAGLDEWAVCSNKRSDAGHAELARLGWHPEIVRFSDAFGGRPKRLGPVLAAVGLGPDEVVFIGDTGHDRRCSVDAGCRFVLAGWNPRAEAMPDDRVAASPGEVLSHLV